MYTSSIVNLVLIASAILVSSCTLSVTDEDVILVGGGVDWYADEVDGAKLFCGSRDCANQVVVVSDDNVISVIYVNGSPFFAGVLDVDGELSRCGEEMNIDYVEYYEARAAPNSNRYLQGMDLYFRVLRPRDNELDGAVLEIGPAGTVKVECTELD